MTRKLLISTMKNEGPYILEWVAYHRVIGFDDFLIYTNDCEDGTAELLDRLTELGVVRHVRNEVLRRGPHKSALKYAMAHPATAAADWIYIADVDEFLNVKVGDGSVDALLDHVGDADAIPVAWRLFSHDDNFEFRDALVIETMTDAERPLEDGGQADRFTKTIFRNSPAVERFGLHGPHIAEGAAFVFSAPDGRRLGPGDNLTRPARQFGYEGAQVNHYAVRSLDGYLVKKDRGRANHVRHVLGSDYWRKMCRGGERDLTIQRHLAATKAEMARLRADETVDALHQDAVAWHEAKVAELRGLEDFAAMRAEIVELAQAKDHHRAVEPPPPAPAPASAAPPAPPARPVDRLRALCDEMRSLLDKTEPYEAAMNAHRRLDEIERGLFGAEPR